MKHPNFEITENILINFLLLPKLSNIQLSTKNYSHSLKVESYIIWWECLGLRAQEKASQ